MFIRESLVFKKKILFSKRKFCLKKKSFVSQKKVLFSKRKFSFIRHDFSGTHREIQAFCMVLLTRKIYKLWGIFKYYNSVLYGLPSYQITRLQHVQNAAARPTMRIQKFDHITPILISLHWLPIEARISFKILLLTYKILNGLAPGYLSDLISAYKHSRALRSAHKNLLAVPRTKLKTFGDRCFSVASPILWNGLPSSIKLSPSVPVFKKRLKTHFFKEYFSI